MDCAEETLQELDWEKLTDALRAHFAGVKTYRQRIINWITISTNTTEAETIFDTLVDLGVLTEILSTSYLLDASTHWKVTNDR